MVHREQLDRTFAALADPVRRTVLQRLARGDASVSALAGDHAISLPAFIKHLRVLESANLVTTVKVGRVRTCRLSEPALAAAETWISTRRQFWHQQLESLVRYFQSESAEAQTWPPSQAPSPSKSAGSSRRRRRASTTRGRRPKS